MDLREKFEMAQQALSFYDYEQAEKIAWQIREERPDLAAVYLLLGNIYTNTDRRQDAVSAYQHAVELEPDSIEGYNNLGIAFRKTGKLKNSLKAFEKAHSLAPERGDITYNLANCHKELGDLERAEQMYRSAISLDPDFLMAYNNLGNLLQHRGDTKGAIQFFKKGLDHDPNHPMLRYNLGIALEGQGQLEEAIAEYRRSLKGKPGWARALNNLGVTLQKTGHLQESEQTFQDLLKVDENNVQAHNNIGVLLVAQQKFDQAEHFFQKALTFNPDYKNAALNLGKLHVESGDEEQALKELQTLAAQDPDNQEIRFELATLLFRSGKVNAALNESIYLLHIDPNNPDYLLILGKARRKLGSHAKAIPPLEKALRLRSGFDNAMVELAYTLSDMSRHDEAVRRLEVYLEKNPDNYNIEICRAEIELDRGSLEEARELFQRMNERYPKNERVLKGLMNTFRKLGNREKALEIAEELVHLLGDPQEHTDFDKLEAGLQLYEQIMNDMEAENSNNWQENLKLLLEKEEGDSSEGMEGFEQDLAVQSDEDIEGEMVPIIDVGGIEPVIAVNEMEGETINLVEMEEDIEPPEEDQEEEEEPEKIIPSQTPVPEPEPALPPQPRNRDYSNNAAEAPQPPPAPPQPSPAPPPPQSHPIPVPQYFSQAPPPQLLQVPVTGTPRVQPPAAQSPHEQPSRTEEKPEKPLYPQDMETLEGALADREESPVKSPNNGEPREAGEKTELDQTRAEGLFDYLSKLTDYLPDQERKQYEEGEMRLRMEALRSRLKGKGGLHTLTTGKTNKALKHAQGSPNHSLKAEKVGSTFQYLHELSDQYPNPEIGEVLKQKMRDIIDKLKGPA